MLQVARLSPKQLGDARGLVQHFLLEQRHPDGGFQDRAGQSDIFSWCGVTAGQSGTVFRITL